jgi:hypothetical protein
MRGAERAGDGGKKTTQQPAAMQDKFHGRSISELVQ